MTSYGGKKKKSKSKSKHKSRSKSKSKSKSKRRIPKRKPAVKAVLIGSNKQVIDPATEKLRFTLAKMRDRWQMMTSRSQGLDYIEKLTKAQIVKELTWYDSKEAFDLFMKWFDESVNWKLYYKKHRNLTLKPFIE